MSKAMESQRSTESGPPSLQRLALIGLPVLGFTAGLPEYVEFSGYSLHLISALGLAVLGWSRGLRGPYLGGYMRWAVLLGLWMCLSAIASWDSGTLSRSSIAAAWLVLITPGIANLLRVGSHRTLLFVGMTGAAVFYSMTALGRRLTGRSIFDGPNTSLALILEEKRSVVNTRLLYVIPLLVANFVPKLRRVRPIVVAMAAITILLSGDRAGLLGLAVVGLTYLALRPGIDQKARAVIAGALTALALLMILDQVGGEVVVGRNRLLSFVRGERTTSDEIRELQLKRAWRVGWEHPAFGVGLNNLSGLDHPALDGARNSSVRGRAQKFGVHNTYAQIFGELGLPGVFAFLGLLGSLFVACLRKRGDPEVRAAGSGLAAMLFMMMVNPVSLPFLYLTLAYIVGMLEEKGRSAPVVASNGLRSRTSS